MGAVMEAPALPMAVAMDAERRLFDLRHEARAALFGALEEVEMVEWNEEPRTDEDRADGHEGWCEHAPVGAHLCRRCHEREVRMEGTAGGR